MLPYINEVPKSRSYVNEFRGYNHNEGISEKEIYNGYNLTADEYPVLSTRKPRGHGALWGIDYDILAMNGKLGEAVIYVNVGRRVVFRFNGKEYDGLDSDFWGKRQIVVFGNRLIIFPDNLVFDTAKKELSSALYKESMPDYEISYFINHGDENNPEIEPIELGRGYDFTDGKTGWGLYRTADGALVERAGVRILFPQNLRNTGAQISNYKDIERELYPRLSYYTYPTYKYYLPDGYYLEGAAIGNDYFLNYGDVGKPQNKLYVYADGRIGYQEKAGREVVVDEDADFREKLTIDIAQIKPPIMDFVIECQNRLWGCRKGLNRAGVEVNEIYATKLGTYDDWYTFDGFADSSYAASVATPGSFTGAITLSQNPIFFKESCIHKVYVSASGAHQMYTLDVRGVQEGSHGSLAVVNENVIYKGVRDVLLFDGTNVTPISDAFGGVRYNKAVAGADGNKYVMYCEADSKRYIFTFDTRKGIWHRELIDHAVIDMTVCDHKLYIGTTKGIIIHEASPTDEREKDIKYMLESGVIGYESPDAKTLCRIDFRVKLALGTSFTVWIQYDSDGAWVEAVRYRGTTVIPRCESVYVLPQRCDHFRYKITGTGDMKLYSVSRVYERSER